MSIIPQLNKVFTFQSLFLPWWICSHSIVSERLFYTADPNNKGLKLHRSTYMWIFSINTLEKVLEICDNLKKLTEEPHSQEISKSLRKS